MLVRLSVQNYALIEHTELLPGTGLNVLTGETGAGKSLLVGALGLVLGQRADPSVVLNPSANCVVEAEFRLPDVARLQTLIAEREWEVDLPDNTLIVRRTIQPGGKSRAFVNDEPVTLPILAELVGQLVELHGQHDAQLLLEPRHQLAILDAYAGLTEPVAAFARLLAQWRAVRKQLTELQAQESEATRQLDYYRHQWQELEDAALSTAEEEQLERELHELEHAEQVQLLLNTAVQALTDDETCVDNTLRGTLRKLDEAAQFSGRVQPEQERLQQALEGVTEAARNLRRLADGLERDPERLAEVQQRLDVYNRLKRKFAVRTAAELMALRDGFAQQVQGYATLGDRIAALETEARQQEQELAALGLQLETRRQEAIGQLQPSVVNWLQQVALPQAQFGVELSRRTAPATGEAVRLPSGERVGICPEGLNTVEFRIATNKGFEPGPLRRVASGGEVSRVMLALKAALAARTQLAVLIFDEIDTGISGEVALQVGRVMEQLAESHQILAITHLPQIASRRARHFHIYKAEAEGRAVSRLRELTGQERIRHLAELQSGAQPTDAALLLAAELLGTGV
jgi:DNA repair protein RecN (Recombination protein N)